MKTVKIMLAALCAVCLPVPLFSCKKERSAAGVTIEVFDRGTDGGKTDPKNNEWTKRIKEKLHKDENITVEFVAIPRWEETVAINNLMAAGTPPDVCLTYSQETIAQYRDLGGLFDMGPCLDSPLLADLKAFPGDDPALPGRELIRRLEDPETKAVYAIPARRMNTANRNMFIRKDWLDKLGIPVPQTTEEFYRALIAFKQQDPGGVGRRCRRVCRVCLAGNGGGEW
ncbi:MAG: extracellular solute-binding protein [Spirochaetaceae bacterium]|nr:extracellular solute-binding protein [Spirochaetaceae bacterium]